jgi:hypothetical protein
VIAKMARRSCATDLRGWRYARARKNSNSEKRLPFRARGRDDGKPRALAISADVNWRHRGVAEHMALWEFVKKNAASAISAEGNGGTVVWWSTRSYASS